MSRKLVLGLALGALVAFGGGGGAAYWYHVAGKRPAPPGARAAGKDTSGAVQSPAPAPVPERIPPVAASPPPESQPAPADSGDTGAAPATGAPSRLPADASARDGGGPPPSLPGGSPDLRHLVRLYEGMGAKEAASVMGELDPELSTAILLGMRERQAAKVLGLLEPRRAAALTVRMARVRREAAP